MWGMSRNGQQAAGSSKKGNAIPMVDGRADLNQNTVPSEMIIIGGSLVLGRETSAISLPPCDLVSKFSATIPHMNTLTFHVPASST